MELPGGVVIPRRYLETTQEQAYTILIHQVNLLYMLQRHAIQMHVHVRINTTSIMQIHFCNYQFLQVARCEVKNNGARDVIADDTDVFVLLLHFKNLGSLGSWPILMKSPLRQRGSIDIDGALQHHHTLILSLLDVHAFSGCDTLASYYGVVKGKVLKVLPAGRVLHTGVFGQLRYT